MRSYPPARAWKLRDLKARIRDLERSGRDPAGVAALHTWPEIDRNLPYEGLSPGSIHEWLGLTGDNLWIPPVQILIHLASQAEGPIAWVGRRVWPSGHALASGGLLGRSLLVDAGGDERLWAAEQALRAGVMAVLDGSGVDCAGTRRLQLAAEAGGSIALLARPGGERGELSVASTRWAVARAPSISGFPRWTVRLLRCKGVQPADRSWTVELRHATGLECVSAEVVGGSGAQAIGRRSRHADRPQRQSA